MNLLDRTYSFNLRQVLRWGKRLLLVALPFYIVAVFWNEWALDTGGVAPGSSPFRAMIPEECVAFADRNSGLSFGRRWWDTLLFQGRITRMPMDPFPVQHFGSCFGYAIIAGLHSGGTGSGFIDVYQDAAGKPVVTVSVTYHQRYVRPTTETARETQQ